MGMGVGADCLEYYGNAWAMQKAPSMPYKSSHKHLIDYTIGFIIDLHLNDYMTSYPQKGKLL